MRRHHPLRLASALLAAALFGVAAAPRVAAAQIIPIRDLSSNMSSAVNMVGRLGDWMVTANWWLKETRRRTDAMIEQTESIKRVTRQYEDMAVGQMGRFGEEVSNWRSLEDIRNQGRELGLDEFGMASVCGVSRTADSICSAGQRLRNRYDRLLQATLNSYRFADTVLFVERGRVEDQLLELLGPALQRRVIVSTGPEAAAGGPSRAAAAMAGEMEGIVAAERHLARPIDLARVQGQQSVALREASERLVAAIDSVTRAETEGREISSGRAQQLQGYMTHVESLVEIERARSQLQLLDLGLAMTANQVREARVSRRATITGARGG